MGKKVLLSLLIILVIASFFRIWQLNTIPPGLYPDEAINANDALLQPRKIFYPENNGREGLFINLITLSFSIFGASVFSLRLVSAIIGILTVFGLYLLTKEIFQITSKKQQATRIALLSSFFLAISFWHVNFSRIGFRGILVPLVLVLGFYFLFRGFRQEKIRHFVFSGIIFGLGFYTYIAFRLVVVLFFFILISWWFVYRRQNLQKKFLLATGYWLLACIIIALPIGIYFLGNPEYFVSRATGVSVFSQENLLGSFGGSLIKHLGMFNFFGDFNWRHNISGSPILFWPIGILFLIGLAIAIKDFIISLRRKKCFGFPRNKVNLLQDGQVSGFMLSWWFVMLLPGILTYEGIPHSLRCIGAIPPTFIFAALGFEFLYQKIKKQVLIRKNSLNYWLLIAVLIILAFSFMLAQYSRYFILWAETPEVEDAFSKNYLEIGNYLNSLFPETQKYVIVNQSGVPVSYLAGLPMPAQTPIFIERTKFEEPRAIYLLPENLDYNLPSIPPEEKTVIILMRYDENLILKLWQKFPNGEIEERNGIWIYKINASSF